MTQYSLRNTYYGNFEYGKRQGHGTFLYANGSKYEGDWHNNVKHGRVNLILQIFFNLFFKTSDFKFNKGKFTYKDGKVYEGFFEDDKMTDTPTFKRTSKISDQISKIKTRIPSGLHSIFLDIFFNFNLRLFFKPVQL